MTTAAPAPEPASAPPPPAVSPRRRFRALRAALRVLGWTLAIVLVLLIAVFVFLQTGPGKDLVRTVVLDVLNDTFHGRLELDELDGFLPFDVELVGFRAYDPDGLQVLSVARLTADFHPLELLDTTVHLSDVRIDRPDVAIFDARGRVALLRAFEPRTPSTDETPSPWIVRFEGIDLEHGRVDGLVAGEDLALTEIAIDLTLGLGPQGLTWPHLELSGQPTGSSELVALLTTAASPDGGRVIVTSRGEIQGDTLRLDALELGAGDHHLATRGSVELAGPLVAELEILDLALDLSRLPAAARQALVGPDPPPGVLLVDGRGRLAVGPDGVATVDLTLGTPWGHALLQANAGIVQPGTPELRLRDWAFTLDLADLVPPPALLAEMPTVAGETRADVRVEGIGAGLPLDSGAHARVAVTIDERAPNDGHLELVLTRVADDARDGAPTFRVELASLALTLQPWLALAGEPELVGEIGVLYVDGDLALPAAGSPRLRLAASFDAAASGRIMAIGKPLDAPRLDGSAHLEWDGVGLPRGRVDLAAVDLGFDLGGARTLDLGFALRTQSDGEPELVGQVTASDLRWEAMRIARIEVPLELALEGLDTAAPRPRGRVRWHASGIDLGDQRLVETAGDLRVVPERDGLRVRGTLRTVGLDLDSPVDLAARSSDLVIDAFVGPDPAGDPAIPLGGPIDLRLAGALGEVRQGPRRAARVAFDDLRVVMARGPAGPIAVTGVTRWTGLATPEVSAGQATIDLDLALDPARALPSGVARVDVSDLSLPDGQRFDRVVVDALARPDGQVEYSGNATQRRPVAREPGEAPVDRGVSAHFAGTLTLPTRDRALVVGVRELRLRRPGDREDFLVADAIGFDADGWVSLERLVVRTVRTAGELELGGRFRPADGAIDLRLDAKGLAIPAWVALVEDALGWAGLAAAIDLPAELDGELGLNLRVGGTLAAPTATAELTLDHVAFGARRDAGAHARLALTETGVEILAALAWHDGGDLSLEARLPARASLSPPGLAWDDARPVHLALSIDESDLEEVFAWADALAMAGTPSGAELREAAGVQEIAGALRFDLIVDGTPADPRLRTTLVGRPLAIGAWKDGSLVLEGSARGDASSFRLVMADADNRTQALCDVALSFGIARALRQPDPLAWIRDAMRERESAIELDVPRVALAETPLVTFLPDDMQDLAAAVDLTLAGTLRRPILDGSVRLTSAELTPFDLGLGLDFSTSDEVVDVRIVAARPTGDALIEGLLSVPMLGDLLESPASAPRLLDNPRLSLELQSADVAAFDFWELNQALGDLATQLFPDGRVMLDLSAQGGPEGLNASLMTRVRTTTPVGVPPPATAEASGIRRNAADDVRLALLVAPDRVTLNLALVQDSRSVTPFLAIQFAAAVGPRVLLSPPDGKPIDLARVPIEGRIRAGEFRLEGFASAFRDVLGTSGGHLTGDVLISGTLAQPRFAQSLIAQFQPIVVAPLGLAHDFATVNIDFVNGTDWLVTVNELYDETRKTTQLPVSRCGIEPFKSDVVDYTVHPYLAIQLSGSIPSLDPKKMTLGGCIGLRDYSALAKRDMSGRIDGELKLGGTVARPEVRGKLTTIEAVLAPNLASKTIRPIGTPLDVTLVRGAPAPPLERPERNPYKTGVLIDVGVVIPKDAVRLEPSLMQLHGEVRAVLYPHGTLQIRTASGELGIVGTIEVPREQVLLYGHAFKVDPDSRIVFTGDMSTDPQISFTARYNIAHVDLSSIGLTTTRDSEVVVRVTGNATEPRLSFSSTPSMDEANILSVIALGIPAGSEAIGEAVQAQLFTAIMGMATLQFARDFQRRLGLDVLRIEAQSADPTDSRLTVGKRLAEDLLLYYYLDPAADDDEDSSRFWLEYRLTRFLSVVSRAGDSGDVGLELNLRFQE